MRLTPSLWNMHSSPTPPPPPPHPKKKSSSPLPSTTTVAVWICVHLGHGWISCRHRSYSSWRSYVFCDQYGAVYERNCIFPLQDYWHLVLINTRGGSRLLNKRGRKRCPARAHCEREARIINPFNLAGVHKSAYRLFMSLMNISWIFITFMNIHRWSVVT